MDDDWDYDPEDFCFYQYKGGKMCGASTAGDSCDQCGVPLCPMHAETGAMFCDQHPTNDYAPSSESGLGEMPF